MSERLVTIVTPSFNQGQFIRSTIDSVAAQDYPAIEHIVIDGGSTDGTMDVLRAVADTHRLTWISEPDLGQADAIRKGFARSHGDVLAWLNSDDVYLRPDAVSRVVDVIQGGAAVVTGAGAYLNESGKRLVAIPLRHGLDHATIRRLDTVLQPATFFLREVYDRCPIEIGLRYVFDWELFIRMSAITAFTPLDLEIAGYRLHAAGKTVSGGLERQRELLTMARRYRTRPVVVAMGALVAAYARAPGLARPLTRAAWISNRLTRNHGLPC